jgi:hypothetical protein
MKLPSYFLRFGSKIDGSASLSFGTQELSAEDFARLKRELGSFGWLVFAPQEDHIEIPNEKITDERKKPSERQRAVLYLISQKKGIPKDEFEQWYRAYMDKHIERLKEQLD